MTRLAALAALVTLATVTARADKLVLVAGGGDGPDGSPAVKAKLVQPFGVTIAHGDGTVFIVEMAKGERLRSYNLLTHRLITLAGSLGEKGYAGDGGGGTQARFNGMHSLAADPTRLNMDIYLADTWNNCVRKYDLFIGKVTAFAGTGEKGFGGDGGPALKAKFGGVYCIALDRRGPNQDLSVYITDLDNRRIRKVDGVTGIVTTVAGNGQKGVPKDGESATEQPLVDPRAAVVDAKGNLYILERSGHALRVVDAAGRIRTVAGTGKAGSGGVGGKALEAQMNGPKHLCVDRDGSVVIADTENHRILRYVPGEEKLVHVAGSGKKGSAGVGGDPLKAELSQPHGVTVHPHTGELWVVDTGNNRILKITKD
jgi:DNA-binding beta-propeller fold protein YncE